MISLLEWSAGGPGVQRGGPNVMAADWAGRPAWIAMPDSLRPGWGTASPGSGSALVVVLLEELPPAIPWQVRVWWDLRTDPGPRAELRLSAMAWDQWLHPVSDGALLRVPWWVDTAVLPLAVVMEVMS